MLAVEEDPLADATETGAGVLLAGEELLPEATLAVEALEPVYCGRCFSLG
jgi:hypothetical protein